ncbi:1-deoxy-D-xylulose-5-phosphate reductoisomerase, partial [Klebsiella oxytoca]
QISFPGIWKLVEAVMDDHTPADPCGELAPILEADQWARRRAAELLPSFSRPC